LGGLLYQVVRDLLCLPGTVAQPAEWVQDLEHASGETRAAEFRDRSFDSHSLPPISGRPGSA
jgi:selenocysteine-specific elongation factor